MPVESSGSEGSAPPGVSFESEVTAVAALAEPARRALYGFVAAQPEPVSRDQAAVGTGVARHVAKFHLDKLVEDGLLDFEYRRPPERRGPGAGRPAKVYRRSGRQISVTLPARDYEFAGRVLARAVTDAEADGTTVSEAVARAAHREGRTRGEAARRRAGPQRGRDAGRTVALGVLEECGFEPRRGPDGISLVNCPFHALAQDFTQLVCGMNLDLMQGLLEGLGLTTLEARLDPAPGQCCVRLSDRVASGGVASDRGVSSRVVSGRVEGGRDGVPPAGSTTDR